MNMKRKALNLILVLAALAGGLLVGLSSREASAASNCPAYYCCDPNCIGIRSCWSLGSQCVCETNCHFNRGGGD